MTGKKTVTKIKKVTGKSTAKMKHELICHLCGNKVTADDKEKNPVYCCGKAMVKKK